MIHHGQGLPLGLETGDHLAAVHARLDQLEGDLALHGPGLLGHEDGAHAAFADLLEQLVGADHRAGTLAQGFIGSGWRPATLLAVENPFSLGMRFEQQGDLLAQLWVAAAGLVQERFPLGGRLLYHGQEDLPDSLEVRVHGMEP